MLCQLRNLINYPLDLKTPNLIKPFEKAHLIISIVGISLQALKIDQIPNLTIDFGRLNPSKIDSFHDRIVYFVQSDVSTELPQ